MYVGECGKGIAMLAFKSGRINVSNKDRGMHLLNSVCSVPNGSESHLRNTCSLCYSGNFSHFVRPENSLPF
jgi:hypothetical protein